MKKILILIAFVSVLFVTKPYKVLAFDPMQIIDPFCLFACEEKKPTTITNSYNQNSNINSPGGSVIVTGTTRSEIPKYSSNTTPVYLANNPVYSPLTATCYSTPTSANVGDVISWRSSTSGGNGTYYITWSGSDGLSGLGTSITRSYSTAGSKFATITVVSDGQTISRNCNNNVEINNYNYPVYNTPVYYPTYTYPTYYNSYGSLGVSCYSTPTSANVGDTISWRTSPYGGDGNYYITWTGNDGLSGYGSSIYKTYNYSGSKYASVTVTSAGQTVTQNCSNNVQIYDNNYYNNNNNYYYNNNYSSQIYISCSANTTFSPIESNVTWQANVTGGNGYYTYSWTGTDNLFGTNRLASVIYHTPGVKSASLTVYSGGQTYTQACSNTVTIGSQNNQYYSNNNSGNIQVACYADKTPVSINTPVTWSVEATGGSGNFTYSWTGTDGISGNQPSLTTYYNTSGKKSATVTAVSSNGQSITQSCGNVVLVKANIVQNSKQNNKIAKTDKNSDQLDSSALTASSLFSLKNVPWGSVAVLVILILVFTIIYLILNKNKI